MVSDSVRRYRFDLVTILLGLAFLVAVLYIDGFLVPIIGFSFTVGGVLQLLARRAGTSFRVYAAIGILTLALPGVAALGLGLLGDSDTLLLVGVFFLTLAGLLLLGVASSVDTETLTPATFLVFAVGMFLLGQELATLVMVCFALFSAYRAVDTRPRSE